MDRIKIPPHNEQIEKACLGCMLLEKENIQLLRSILQPEDFYKPLHSTIFKAVIQLTDESKPVDLLTITEATAGEIEPVILAELMNSVPTTTNAEYYAKIIKDYKRRRDLIAQGTRVIEGAYNGEYTKELEILIQVASEHGQERAALVSVGDLTNSTLDRFEKYHNEKGNTNAIKTGFSDFDRKFLGLSRSELVLIAARPSMGKSAIVLNIASHIAIDQRGTVAIFSLEMSKDLIVERLACSLALVDSTKAKTGSLQDDEWQRLTKATMCLNGAKLYIDDVSPQSITEIKQKCRSIKGLDLVIIDYLDFITADIKTDMRVQEIGSITKALKGLAKELNMPVILLSQLNRKVEERANKRPMLSDLRDSGNLEQDADVVIFLYRDEYYNPDTDKKNLGEIIVAKNRNGQTGTVELVWLGQFTKYVNKVAK